MPDSESFDAFYARTVGNVTSQMHALASGDGAADHAIREAYARAYQQWYEIAGYPDTEGWVLAVAREAYQRRRPMAAPLRDPARPGHDPLSMPGMFRPAAAPGAPAGTGDTTLTPPAGSPAQPGDWFTPASASGTADDAAANGPVPGISGVFGGRGGATAITRVAGDHPAPEGPPAAPAGPSRPGWLAGISAGGRRPSVTFMALVAVAAVAIAAGAGYLIASRGNAGSSAARSTTTTRGKPAVQMLPAGRTGTRSAIPWSIVTAGWTLAEVSSAAPGRDGTATGTGTVTMYLVDPEGGRYQVQKAAGAAPMLLAWSGNAQNALFEEQQPGSGTAVSYELLSLTTGTMSPLPLPAGLTAVGFTRPDGLNILAVHQTAAAFQLERFNLQGVYQATIGSLPVKSRATAAWQYCGTFCGALSSPDGLFAVWGRSGDEMQLLSNAGGPVIRRLVVPGNGSTPSCIPVTWWNANTVLASCAVTGKQPEHDRLWLVPANGSTPTALTAASGSPSGMGDLVAAWQAAGAVYVNSTDFAQCPGAASGPGGLALDAVSGGSLHRLSVAGTTNNHTSVVAVSGGRLLLLAETSCPGTSSLLWWNLSTGATQTVLSAPTSQVGVIAAVPYGNGPTATGVGLDG